MIKYAILGAGWRSEFYLRIAELCPDKFRATGICIRSDEKRERFAVRYKVPVFKTIDELLKTDFHFIVSCVDKLSTVSTIGYLCKKGIPVLSETPINKMPDDYSDSWKVQVAEQFHFMPHNQAVKKIIDSGILGEVHQVQLSCCHEYHAASLIRFFLGTKYEMPKVSSFSLDDEIIKYNSREGFQNPDTVISNQTVSILKFKNKSAIYDFSAEQYFSDIRASRICIRGTNGEIVNNRCTYLKNGLPLSFDLVRMQTGINENLDGYSLTGISGGNEYLYKNPFVKARLSDEEIAIATCLEKMDEFMKEKIPFYSLQDACVDYNLLSVINNPHQQ